MPSVRTPATPFTTRELSPENWPDFERLVSQGGGWDFCGCMLFQRGCQPRGKEYKSRAAAHQRNLRDKKELVEQGSAHGILVYADTEPVGWCAFGPVDELPLPGEPRVDKRVPPVDPTSRWRIPCFVTRKTHRRQGVASLALGAAVDAIRRGGGGWVEATPIVTSHYSGRYHQLVHTHGRDSAEVRAFLDEWPSRDVRGVGAVPATRGAFGGVSYPGTVSMFERAGFEAVRVVRGSYVLMRRRV